MKLLNILPEHRPRELLQKQGATFLTNAQLLALILKSGTKKESILDLCEHILVKHSLPGLAKLSLKELQQEHGIGKAKACQLQAVFELAQRTSSQPQTNPFIRSAQDIATLYLQQFAQKEQENVLALYLDTKNRLIKDELITLGLLNSSLIHPREIFHGAIKNMANSLVIIHNHPSGDPTPSQDDLKVTKILEKTGEVIGIPFMDHVILGKNSFWSYKEGRVQNCVEKGAVVS